MLEKQVSGGEALWQAGKMVDFRITKKQADLLYRISKRIKAVGEVSISDIKDITDNHTKHFEE